MVKLPMCIIPACRAGTMLIFNKDSGVVVYKALQRSRVVGRFVG